MCAEGKKTKLDITHICTFPLYMMRITNLYHVTSATAFKTHRKRIYIAPIFASSLHKRYVPKAFLIYFIIMQKTFYS